LSPSRSSPSASSHPTRVSPSSRPWSNLTAPLLPYTPRFHRPLGGFSVSRVAAGLTVARWIDLCVYICIDRMDWSGWIDLCVYICIDRMDWSGWIDLCVCICIDRMDWSGWIDLCVYICIDRMDWSGWIDLCVYICIDRMDWSMCVYLYRQDGLIDVCISVYLCKDGLLYGWLCTPCSVFVCRFECMCCRYACKAVCIYGYEDRWMIMDCYLDELDWLVCVCMCG
jgi:hypothetical protein